MSSYYSPYFRGSHWQLLFLVSIEYAYHNEPTLWSLHVGYNKLALRILFLYPTELCSIAHIKVFLTCSPSGTSQILILNSATSVQLQGHSHELRVDPGLVTTPFSSFYQSYPTLPNHMNCSTLGFPVHHQLLELVQSHVHRVDDAIQQSHPLSAPSFAAFSLNQHQDLFQWVSSSHQVAKILEFQLQHQVLPMNIQHLFSLGFSNLSSLQSKVLSRIFSNTTVQKHQFFSAQPSL